MAKNEAEKEKMIVPEFEIIPLDNSILSADSNPADPDNNEGEIDFF